jgi:anti-sigma B factor antagonist
MKKVDVRQQDDVVIVDFNERLVAGVGEELLSEVINELLAENWKKILLNLSNVDYIDSLGLGELVQSLKLAQRFGASLRLLKPQDRIRKTLRLAMLLPMFPVYDTEADALRSFAEV